ncbi:MAG TPA: hypothetical protein VLM11_06495 [Streptosporangiaceae bacterium]|nr:hypothetical protein [Streptosporangiaceae bacterium]
MHDLKVGGREAPSSRLPRRGPLGRDSIFWLVLVSILFLAAELTPALLRMPLGTDEITYIARTSIRVNGVSLPPVHGQGVALLAAPVTLLTQSLTVIRVWMALLSAIGLFLATLCWRRLRPNWVLAIAALIFGGLAISQNSGVQVYPDWWGALGVLALTGLVLQVVTGTMRDRVTLPSIALASLIIVLMRPQNIIFLMGPALLAVVIVRPWRKPKALLAMGVGIVLGCLQWVIAAYVMYGGLATRIHSAKQEPPSFGLYFSFFTQAKVLSGPWYCIPTHGCQGVPMPGELLWWVAFLALAGLGLWVTWRTAAKASSAFAVATAVWVVAFYSFLVPFGAPRYITPSLALAAILAADGVEWLVTKTSWRRAGVVLTCAFILSELVSQRLVLQQEAQQQTRSRGFEHVAAELQAAGVKPPCVLASTPVAYYAGCMVPWDGEHMPAFLASTPQGIKNWRPVYLPNVGQLGTVVYIPAGNVLTPPRHGA